MKRRRIPLKYRAAIVWLLWLAAFLYVEIPAMANKERGDTLSDFHEWVASRHPAARAGLLGFYAWLGWHLHIEMYLRRRFRER